VLDEEKDAYKGLLDGGGVGVGVFVLVDVGVGETFGSGDGVVDGVFVGSMIEEGAVSSYNLPSMILGSELLSTPLSTI
jgi:hypothetical protein